MDKAVLFWSGGKDSAMALQRVRDRLQVVALVATVNRPAGTIAAHGVPEQLVVRQAKACGLPLDIISIPSPCPNEAYETAVVAALEAWKANSVSRVVFGDLFLEDIRAYRDRLLDSVDMEGVFPLWSADTNELAREVIALGFKAVTVCVSSGALGESFAGREFDSVFLEALPDGIDPCGENGEFHTFVYDGPLFSEPVAFSIDGSRVEGQHCFTQLVP